jgi:hypothetical protein
MCNYAFLKTLHSARIRVESSQAKHFQHVQIKKYIIIFIIIVVVLVIIIVCLMCTTQVLY